MITCSSFVSAILDASFASLHSTNDDFICCFECDDVVVVVVTPEGLGEDYPVRLLEVVT